MWIVSGQYRITNMRNVKFVTITNSELIITLVFWIQVHVPNGIGYMICGTTVKIPGIAALSFHCGHICSSSPIWLWHIIFLEPMLALSSCVTHFETDLAWTLWLNTFIFCNSFAFAFILNILISLTRATTSTISKATTKVPEDYLRLLLITKSFTIALVPSTISHLC